MKTNNDAKEFHETRFDKKLCFSDFKVLAESCEKSVKKDNLLNKLKEETELENEKIKNAYDEDAFIAALLVKQKQTKAENSKALKKSNKAVGKISENKRIKNDLDEVILINEECSTEKQNYKLLSKTSGSTSSISSPFLSLSKSTSSVVSSCNENFPSSFFCSATSAAETSDLYNTKKCFCSSNFSNENKSFYNFPSSCDSCFQNTDLSFFNFSSLKLLPSNSTTLLLSSSSAFSTNFVEVFSSLSSAMFSPYSSTYFNTSLVSSSFSFISASSSSTHEDSLPFQFSTSPILEVSSSHQHSPLNIFSTSSSLFYNESVSSSLSDTSSSFSSVVSTINKQKETNQIKQAELTSTLREKEQKEEQYRKERSPIYMSEEHNCHLSKTESIERTQRDIYNERKIQKKEKKNKVKQSEIEKKYIECDINSSSENILSIKKNKENEQEIKNINQSKIEKKPNVNFEVCSIQLKQEVKENEHLLTNEGKKEKRQKENILDKQEDRKGEFDFEKEKQLDSDVKKKKNREEKQEENIGIKKQREEAKEIQKKIEKNNESKEISKRARLEDETKNIKIKRKKNSEILKEQKIENLDLHQNFINNAHFNDDREQDEEKSIINEKNKNIEKATTEDKPSKDVNEKKSQTLKDAILNRTYADVKNVPSDLGWSAGNADGLKVKDIIPSHLYSRRLRVGLPRRAFNPKQINKS